MRSADAAFGSARRNAIARATIGAANEVPRVPRPRPGTTPGATKSTCGPLPDSGSTRSRASTAPTPTTPGYAAGYSGGAAGPFVAGVIHDATGSYRPAFLLAIVLCGVSAAAVWLAAPRKVRRPPRRR